MDEYGHWQVDGHMSILFCIVLLSLLIVLGIAYLIQHSKSRTPPAKDAAMDTLKKRYALGEISAEEFMQKKRDLQS